MNAATQALADQAQAAATDALGIMRQVAERLKLTVSETDPGPVTQRIITKLSRRLLAGDITLCHHLSWTAPEPVHWAAWRPGRLRCARCAYMTILQTRGTREDRTCDSCRRRVPRLAAAMVQLPPVICDLPGGGPAACVPPVSAHFGLCRRCRAADQEGSASL